MIYLTDGLCREIKLNIAPLNFIFEGRSGSKAKTGVSVWLEACVGSNLGDVLALMMILGGIYVEVFFL